MRQSRSQNWSPVATPIGVPLACGARRASAVGGVAAVARPGAARATGRKADVRVPLAVRIRRRCEENGRTINRTKEGWR